MPPLRAREGDIEVLSNHFGRRMASEMEWPRWPGFSEQALAQLKSYGWPGNVRELRNVIERAVYRWEDPDEPVDAIEFDPFASPWRPHASPKDAGNKVDDHKDAASQALFTVAEEPVEIGDLRSAVLAHEKKILETALAQNRHNQRATAKALNLSYDQLRHCLKRHSLLG